MTKSSGKERFLTALDKKIPDRVPIFEIGIDDKSIINIAKIIGKKNIIPNFKYNEAKREDEILKFYSFIIKELGLDACSSSFSVGLKKINEKYFVNRFGVKFIYSPHGEPVVVEGPIKTKKDLKKLNIEKLVSINDAKNTMFLMDQFDDTKAQVINIMDPFKISWYLRGGMQNLLIDYIDNPTFVKDLAKIGTEYNIAIIDIAASLGVNVICMAGDLAGNDNTIMSTPQFKEFIKPYEKQITEYAHKKKLKIIKHSDGNLWPIINDIIEVGFDGIHPIQPQCMDIREFKKLYNKKICIVGNIDCVDLLCQGSVNEVEQVVKQTIDIAAKDGGYIMCSSNSIHPGVKPENYIAMVRTTQNYGLYNKNL